jgi:enoyl-CoA hydratase/carnithine racemase
MGGGLEIAMCGDLRIAGESAQFAIPVKRLGHMLALPELEELIELVGRAAALELLLEGRVWTAQEAFVKGLATRVVADDAVADEVYATARRIASGAPLAARQHKAFARRLMDPTRLSEEELDAPARLCDSEDYREGVRAFLAKEKPTFRGR